jgi:hypothetical protein
MRRLKSKVLLFILLLASATSCRTTNTNGLSESQSVIANRIHGIEVTTDLLVVDFSFFRCGPCSQLASAQLVAKGDYAILFREATYKRCTFRKALPEDEKPDWINKYPKLSPKFNFHETSGNISDLAGYYGSTLKLGPFPWTVVFDKTGAVVGTPATYNKDTWATAMLKICQ